MVNFQESWYLSLEFQRDVTQFCGISMGGTWFCLEFPGVKGKIKSSMGGGGGTFRKVCPQDPLFSSFFWNSPLTAFYRLYFYTQMYLIGNLILRHTCSISTVIYLLEIIK